MAVTRSTRVHYIAIILYGLISVVVYAPLSVLRDSSNVLRATVDTENGEKKKPVASLWPVRASGIYFCIIEIPSTFLLTTINTLTVHQLSKTLMLFIFLARDPLGRFTKCWHRCFFSPRSDSFISIISYETHISF